MAKDQLATTTRRIVMAGAGTAYLREYYRVLGDLMNVIVDDQMEYILGKLEEIPDEGEDLAAQFDTNPDGLKSPARWLDLARLMRFTLGQRSALNREYDNFVTAYTRLSSNPSANDHEAKLRDEIGTLMYQIDDLSGNYERLSGNLIRAFSAAMKDVHGLMMEPDEEVFIAAIPADQQLRLKRFVEDMVELVGKLREQVEIMEALVRMRKLILEI